LAPGACGRLRSSHRRIGCMGDFTVKGRRAPRYSLGCSCRQGTKGLLRKVARRPWLRSFDAPLLSLSASAHAANATMCHYHRPTVDLVIPRRVASPQSPTPFHQAASQLISEVRCTRPSDTGAMPQKIQQASARTVRNHAGERPAFLVISWFLVPLTRSPRPSCRTAASPQNRRREPPAAGAPTPVSA
jgi:hypothetical protein